MYAIHLPFIDFILLHVKCVCIEHKYVCIHRRVNIREREREREREGEKKKNVVMFCTRNKKRIEKGLYICALV